MKLIFTIVKQTNKKEVIELIHLYASKAFYSIEDVKGSEYVVFTDKGDSTPIGRLFSVSTQK